MRWSVCVAPCYQTQDPSGLAICFLQASSWKETWFSWAVAYEMMERRKQSEHTHYCYGIPFSHSLNANTECSCKHFCSSTPLRRVVEKDQSLFTQRKPVWIHTVSWINRIQWWDKIHWIVHESDFFWKTHHSTRWCLFLNLCSAINEASNSILDVQSHAIYSVM